MNDLNTVRMYDWTRAILTILMGLIQEFHRTPGKVTGCALVLMYWICEHSTVLKPQTDNMFPRFLKWDIGALINKVQGVDLSGIIKFQVIVDRLRPFDYEREVMGIDIEVMKGAVADVVDGDDGDEHFMDKVKVVVASNDAPMHIGNVETSSGNGREQRSSGNVQHPNMVEWGIETDRLHG